MAKKRMIDRDLVDSDAFLDMPVSAQNLYFHLLLRADDDGFVDSPKKIMRIVGAANDDEKVLSAKGYIISFNSGIIVIRHWKIHNHIKKDRYTPTIHIVERENLVEYNSIYEKTKKIANGPL